jgi:GLPGLI family protein
MKAYLDEPIRKHKIVAWFAMDIPLSFGPEGYQGLPGMILELDYNDGAMIVAADKIDVKKLTTELNVPEKLKGKKVNQAFINDIALKHIKEKTAAEDPWFWGLDY